MRIRIRFSPPRRRWKKSTPGLSIVTVEQSMLAAGEGHLLQPIVSSLWIKQNSARASG